jgi:hypothetical protein
VTKVLEVVERTVLELEEEGVRDSGTAIRGTVEAAHEGPPQSKQEQKGAGSSHQPTDRHMKAHVKSTVAQSQGRWLPVAGGGSGCCHLSSPSLRTSCLWWTGRVIELIQAGGVDHKVYLAATRVLKKTATLFPEVTEEVLKVHKAAGQINIIRRNNGRWLPQHVCDSWRQKTI